MTSWIPRAWQFVEFAVSLRRRALASALVLGALVSAPTEPEKIELLIQSVAGLSHARFVRNGAEYDAAAAADHLRLKLRSAGSRVKTADDFIRYCGSSSSMTGQPYRIRYDDGREETSEAFLRARLAEIESAE
jgi:Family of unknown function (DUF5329)